MMTTVAKIETIRARASDLESKAAASRPRLTYMRDHLDELIAEFTKLGLTLREALGCLFAKEIEQRNANRDEILRMAAHFPFEKTIEEYDKSFQPCIPSGLIDELAKLEWIDAAENVILIGPPGVGKTHLAIGLGMKAVSKGIAVRFYSAENLMETLENGEKDGRFDQKIKALNKYKLLIIDELGYTPFTPQQTQLLFHLINSRYEKKSVVITSNRAPSEWPLFLGDPTASSAILDRLIHHCTPVMIKGESYRMHECRLGQLKTKE